MLIATERLYPSLHVLLMRSFLQGVAMALGSTVGFAIVLALITYILTLLEIIPGMSEMLKNLSVQNYLPIKK